MFNPIDEIKAIEQKIENLPNHIKADVLRLIADMVQPIGAVILRQVEMGLRTRADQIEAGGLPTSMNQVSAQLQQNQSNPAYKDFMDAAKKHEQDG